MTLWQALREGAHLKLDIVAAEQAQWDASHPALQETLVYRCRLFNIAVRRLGWTIMSALFGG